MASLPPPAAPAMPAMGKPAKGLTSGIGRDTQSKKFFNGDEK